MAKTRSTASQFADTEKSMHGKKSGSEIADSMSEVLSKTMKEVAENINKNLGKGIPLSTRLKEVNKQFEKLIKNNVLMDKGYKELQKQIKSDIKLGEERKKVLGDLLKTQRSFQKESERITKGFSDKVNGIIKNIPLVGNILSKEFTKLFTKLSPTLINTLTGGMMRMFGSSSGGLSMGKMAGIGGAALGGVAIFQLGKMLVDAYSKLQSFQIQLVRSTGISKQGLSGIVDMTIGLTRNLGALGISYDDITQSASSLVNELGSTARLTQGLIEGTAKWSKAYGIGTEEASKFASMLMQTQGKTADESVRFVNTMDSFVRHKGVSVNRVMKDILSSSSYIAEYSGNFLNNVAESAVEAAKMGVSLSTFANMSSKFVGIDTSIENITTLNNILGSRMNAMHMNQLTRFGGEQGQQQMRKELLNNVLNRGGSSYLKSDVLAQQTVSSTMGATPEELMKMVTRMERQRRVNLGTATAADREAEKTAKNADSMDDALKSMMTTWDKIKSVVGAAILQPLLRVAKVIEDYVDPTVSSFAEKMAAIIPTEAQIKAKGGGFIGIAKAFWVNFKSAFGEAFDWIKSTAIKLGVMVLRGIGDQMGGVVGMVLGGKKEETVNHSVGLTGLYNTMRGMAKGGLVTKPTLALIGEAGPEMVVPLGNKGLDHSNGILKFARGGVISPVGMGEVGNYGAGTMQSYSDPAAIKAREMAARMENKKYMDEQRKWQNELNRKELTLMEMQGQNTRRFGSHIGFFDKIVNIGLRGLIYGDWRGMMAAVKNETINALRTWGQKQLEKVPGYDKVKKAKDTYDTFKDQGSALWKEQTSLMTPDERAWMEEHGINPEQSLTKNIKKRVGHKVNNFLTEGEYGTGKKGAMNWARENIPGASKFSNLKKGIGNKAGGLFKKLGIGSKGGKLIGGAALSGLGSAGMTLLSGGSKKEAAKAGATSAAGYLITAGLTPILGPFAPLAGSLLAGPAVKMVSEAGKEMFQGAKQGVKGVSQIMHGDFKAGAKNIGKGAFKIATAPGKAFAHAIGIGNENKRDARKKSMKELDKALGSRDLGKFKAHKHLLKALGTDEGSWNLTQQEIIKTVKSKTGIDILPDDADNIIQALINPAVPDEEKLSSEAVGQIIGDYNKQLFPTGNSQSAGKITTTSGGGGEGPTAGSINTANGAGGGGGGPTGYEQLNNEQLIAEIQRLNENIVILAQRPITIEMDATEVGKSVAITNRKSALEL